MEQIAALDQTKLKLYYVPRGTATKKHNTLNLLENRYSNLKGSFMEAMNAFIGSATSPSHEQILSALGESAAAWKVLLSWLTEKVVNVQE